MYPRKPKELADDLESFIHVPVYCFLRYHKHDLSLANAEMLKNASQDEQVAANMENDRLTNRKNNYFYQQASHKNGLYSGGDVKHCTILTGRPPVQLDDQTSPGARLLKELFLLLQNHYNMIKFEELRHFLADPKSPPRSLPRQIEGAAQAPRQLFVDPFRDIEEADTGPTADGNSPTPSRSPSAVSAGSASSRPLDSHARIVAIFKSVWRDKNGQLLDMGPYENDKLYDQFDGNKVATTKNMTNPSSKRKAGSAQSDAAPQPEQKRRKLEPKKTVSHGMQVDLRSVISSSDSEDDI